MADLKVKINKINHLVAWLAWGLFYWLYAYFVATRFPFDWVDYFVFLGVHIGSFYFSVCYAFPLANPQWNKFNRRTFFRIALVVVGEIILIAVIVSLLSVILGGLDVGTETVAEPEANVGNFPDVVVFLYSGLIFALFYLKFAKLESQRDELMAEVEQLRVKLGDSEMTNLEQSLIPHLYSNLLGTVNDAVRQQPEDAPYMVNIFNQIVRLYAPLGPGELVSMADEVEVGGLFLELVEAKLGKRPAIELEVDEAAKQLRVIPMLTMLVLENIDKYGLWDDANHAVGIYIGLRLGHLVVIARNTVKDISAAPPLSTKKGIRSIRERLDARQLSYTMHSGVRKGRFSFVLVIDFE